ncbi:MAG TPA: DeoR/GlpR family DNA-binding transcription regulator [Bacillota bacterium]|nr:DeoR/GlpR family DNA-binding transcription regulator [Bacillota bacterium]
MINLERRKKILEILEKETKISTTELEDRLQVTGATIRSDLREMEREGAIIRFHGGCSIADQVKPSQTPENYMRRSVMYVAEKTAIGKEAGTFVSEGETIFIDASSTTFHMIPFISQLENLTIVTNGIHTAMEIQRYSNFRTVLIGGVLRPHSGAVEGLLCEEMLHRISGDSYFVSGNGFSLNSGLTGHNFYELELKKRFADKCKRKIALVDSSKLNADSTSTFIPADQIDVLITDSGISPEQAKAIRDFGISLVIAEV